MEEQCQRAALNLTENWADVFNPENNTQQNDEQCRCDQGIDSMYKHLEIGDRTIRLPCSLIRAVRKTIDQFWKEQSVCSKFLPDTPERDAEFAHTVQLALFHCTVYSLLRILSLDQDTVVNNKIKFRNLLDKVCILFFFHFFSNYIFFYS